MVRRILILYRYGILGGVCTQIYQRLNNFEKEEVEIHCGFRSDNGAAELFDSICPLHFGINETNVAKLVIEYEFDIVVIIDTPEYLIALEKMDKRPTIVLEVHTSIKKNLEYLGNINPDQIDQIITVSEYMIDEIVNIISFPIERKSIFKMSNIVDTDCYGGELELIEGKLPLIWVGKIDEHKNWKDFIEIVYLLNNDDSDFEFWIVGGHTCNSETAQEVLDLVEDKGLISKFKWFDKVNHPDMPNLYKTVAMRGGVNIVTSKGESFGMSVLESLLSGCPVVSSNVGAISEICSNRNYLKLYDFGDTKTASSLVLETMRHKNKKYKKEIKKLVQQYDSKQKSKEYWNLLYSFID